MVLKFKVEVFSGHSGTVEHNDGGSSKRPLGTLAEKKIPSWRQRVEDVKSHH